MAFFSCSCKHLGFNSATSTIEGAYQSNAQSDIAPHKIIAAQHKKQVKVLPSVKYMLSVLSLMAAVSSAATAQVFAEPLPVVEVADGVYAFQGSHDLMNATNGGAIANVGFVVGDEAVAVVDTGGSPEEGRRLLETIAATTDRPVRYVILTHMHPDHVFGSAALVGPDVAFVGHARLNAALEQRFDHYVAANAAELAPGALTDARRVPATIEVSDRLELPLGGRTLEIRAWPVSHTDNDLTVYDPATRTLFGGDLVFLEHLPSLDGSLRGWQRTIEGLAGIPALRVIPGHGPVPSPWPAALEPERRYFDVLASDIRASLDAGEPLSEAVGKAGRSEAGNWALFDAFNVRNATAAYAELEWE
jgi:quinoprotein relay system zinc metallohydrolase 2